MSNWFTDLGGAIDRAFERRLKRASGQQQEETHQARQHAADDEEGAIINLPRGSVLAEAEAPETIEEGSISNLPRGAEQHQPNESVS